MPERYVRPPLVGNEPRSEQAAVWRFRLLLLLLLGALVVGAVLLILALTPGGEGTPGLNALTGS